MNAPMTRPVMLLAACAMSTALPAAPAFAQAYSPMPPECGAASQAAQMLACRYQQPPANAPVIAQMQHLLWTLGLLIDALDDSCRGWADYARSRQQFESQYNATMENCRNIAANHADCKRQPYGG